MNNGPGRSCAWFSQAGVDPNKNNFPSCPIKRHYGAVVKVMDSGVGKD